MALAGIKVVEFAGLAPGPFAGLILADNGASVTRIDRPSSFSPDLLCRGKRSIAVDSKNASGLALLKKLVANADVVIDPFRPGVMERMGLGPEVFLGSDSEAGKEGLNERLVYARIVGFPRTGPHKDMAGHDINYLALSGVLSMLPGEERPKFPLNTLADFAGGGMACAMGILLALIQRARTSKGQVVNADMVSGSRYVSSFPLLHRHLSSSPLFSSPRGGNTLDGGSPFYDVYTCADGRWMSVGCLEPQFFSIFIQKFIAALQPDVVKSLVSGWTPTLAAQENREEWPSLRTFLTKGFETQTRDFWTKVFDKTDACAVPVLSPEEAAELSTLVSGSPLPMSHPSITGEVPTNSTTELSVLAPGEHTMEILKDMLISVSEQRRLALDGAFGKEAMARARTEHAKL